MLVQGSCGCKALARIILLCTMVKESKGHAMERGTVELTDRGCIIRSRFAYTDTEKRLRENPAVQLVVYAGSGVLVVILREHSRSIADFARLLTDATWFIGEAEGKEEPKDTP